MRKPWFLCLALAIAFVTTGRLGLRLAVPPGFATAVWLPSGLALLGALTIGTSAAVAAAFACFLLNLWTYTDAGLDLGLAVNCAAAVGMGAGVQAWLGARLGRRRAATVSSGGPDNLLRLLALTGPIACLANASWSVFWLWSHHVITTDQWLYTWGTWWIGDSIGVMLVMTLYIAAKAGRQSQVIARLSFVGVPMALAMLSAIVLFYRSSAVEQHSVEADFLDRVRSVTNAFESGVSRYGDALRIFRVALQAEDSITEANFQRLAHGILPLYPGVKAVEWIPVVQDGERAAVERSARQDGHAQFHFQQLDPLSVRPVLAAPKPVYHIVRFVAPAAGNEEVLGFDLASEPGRLHLLKQSTSTGHVTAVAPVSVYRNNAAAPGVLLVLPVFKDRQVIGHLAFVLLVRNMLTTTIGRWLTDDINIDVFSAAHGNQSLFNHHWRDGGKDTSRFHGEFVSSIPNVDGLNWQFVLRPTPAYLAAHRSLQSWGGLAASLVGAALLGVFLIVLNGRNEALAFEVSQRRRIEQDLESNSQDLERARDAAEGASRAKSAFLANMSHEIRTPLGAVLGFSELVCHPDLSTAERDRYLSAIKRNGDQLSGIINDILDISKVEAGKLDLSLETVAVDEIMRDMSSYLRLQAADKGVGLHLDCSPQVPRHIRTDPLRLRQILLNIVGNAIKFTARGRVNVHLGLVPGGALSPHLAITVTDSGPGISPDQAAKLFSPFTQGDVSSKRRHGGTGLGLVLSRRLAQMLGGDVQLVDSVPGVGSTFMITIDPGPLSDVADATVASEAAVVEMAASEPPQTAESRLGPLPVRLDGARVLLIDDAPDNRLLVGRYLKSAGAAVETAENGREAVHKAGTDRFDVLLMDLQMPLMDGYEATAELRRLGYQGPIVALTAHAMKEERERCLSGGFDDHLSKPVDRQTLLRTVERFRDAGGRGGEGRSGLN